MDYNVLRNAFNSLLASAIEVKYSKNDDSNELDKQIAQFDEIWTKFKEEMTN